MTPQEIPHILIDTRPTMGGIARYTFELSKLIQESSYSPHISLFGGEKGKAYQPVQEITGLRSFLRNTLGGGKRIMMDQLALPAAALRSGAEILHSTNYFVPILSQIPVVVTCYDNSIMHFFASKKSGLMKYYERSVFLNGLRKAAHIIVPSKAVASELEEFYGFNSSRVTSIYPPLPSFCFKPPVGKVTLDEKILQNQFFLTVGTIEPRKNLHRLLEGWKKAYLQYKIPLVIVGPYGWQEHKLVDELRNLSTEIYWLSGINDATLAFLYHKALALIQFSLEEGFDYPIAEGLCLGTPIIASDIDVHREVLADCGVFVSPHDPEGLAHKMLEILHWSSQRRAIYQDQASRQADQLKKSTSVDPYISIYREIIQRE